MEDTVLKIPYPTNKDALKLNVSFRFRMFLPEDSLLILRVIVHCRMTYSSVATSVLTHMQSYHSAPFE